MANTDIISDVVSSKAFKEAEKYTALIKAMESQFVSTAKQADFLAEQLKKTTGLRQLMDAYAKAQKATDELKKTQQQLAELQKKREAAEAKAAQQAAERQRRREEQERKAAEREGERQKKREAAEAERARRQTADYQREKLQAAERQRLHRMEAREQLAAIGSLERKRATLNRLIFTYDRLTDAEKQAAEGKDMLKSIQALDKEVKTLEATTGRFQRNVGNYDSVWGRFEQNGMAVIKNLGGGFDNFFKGVAAGVAAIFTAEAAGNLLGGSIDTISGFEQSLADLEAITGASGATLDGLGVSALEAGKNVMGGGSAVVEAYKLIASAKPELLENAEALKKVTDNAIILSQASGLELPDAASALTDALNQFNATAEESGRYINVLAAGAKFGAAEVPDVTEALLKFGAVARGTNVSIEESVALIEALAEKGLKGAEAGTALRNVLLKISGPDALPKEAKKAIEGYGISLVKLADKSIPITERLTMLRPLLNDSGKLMKVFGMENDVAAANVLENIDRVKQLGISLTGTKVATEQAEARTKTIAYSVNRLKESWNAYIIGANGATGASAKVGAVLRFIADNLPTIMKGVLALVAVWGTYRLYILAATIATRAKTAAMIANAIIAKQNVVTTAASVTITNAEGTAIKANTIVTYAIVAAKKIWALATTQLTMRIALLNRTITLTPIGLFLGLVGGLALLFGSLSARASESASAIGATARQQKILNEVTKEATDSIAEQVGEINSLVATASNLIASDEQRLKAMDDLIAIDPSFRLALQNQKIDTEALTVATASYIEKLKLQAVTQAAIARSKKEFEKVGEIGLIKEEIDRVILQVNRGTMTVEQAYDKMSDTGKKFFNENALFKQGGVSKSMASLLEVSKAVERQYKETAETAEDAKNLEIKVQQNFTVFQKKKYEEDVAAFNNRLKNLKAGTEEYKKEYDALQAYIAKNKPGSEKSTTNKDTGTATFTEPTSDKELNKRAQAAKKAADDAKKRAEDLAAFNKKISDDELKAQREADENRAKQAADTLKRVAENEKNFIIDRLNANALYYSLLEQQARAKGDFDKNQLLREAAAEKEKILGRELTVNELMELDEQMMNQTLAIEARTQADIAKIRGDGKDVQEKMLEHHNTRMLEVIRRNGERRLATIDTNEANELTGLENKLKEKLISQEDYEKERLKIQEKYALERLKLELETAEALLASQKKQGADTADAEKNLAAIKLKIAESESKVAKDDNQKKLALDKEYKSRKLDLYKQLGEELAQTVFAFIDAQFERQKQNLEREKQLVDERRDAELKKIEALNISDEERANRIKVLDARAEADKRAIEKRQRQVDIQKAKADKAKALFDIAVNTAVGITQVIKNPLLIALVSAIGALQAARVLATPIPQYFKGTDNHPGGPAIVGERGRELVIEPTGKMWETPDTPTLLPELAAGAQVIPHEKYLDMLATKSNNSVLAHGIRTEHDFMAAQMQMIERGIQATERVEKAIREAPQAIFNISPEGIEFYKRHSNQWTKYFDRAVRFKK